jgi:hypothetical protein
MKVRQAPSGTQLSLNSDEVANAYVKQAITDCERKLMERRPVRYGRRSNCPPASVVGQLLRGCVQSGATQKLAGALLKKARAALTSLLSWSEETRYGGKK